MDDKQRLDEQKLRVTRLVGVLLHGGGWRERRSRGTTGRLVAGLALAALATAVTAGVSFVIEQLTGSGTGFWG